jgi:uncharacterized membrane protein YhaH (DUF805 family)
MQLQESIETCLRKKYAEFDGAATRSEFWWFWLFVAVVGAVLDAFYHPIGSLFYLAMLLPCLGVGARRLHDVNRTAWWLLLLVVPVVGWLVLAYFLAQPGRTPATPI